MRAFYYLFLYFLITCFQYTFTRREKFGGLSPPQAPDERRLWEFDDVSQRAGPVSLGTSCILP